MFNGGRIMPAEGVASKLCRLNEKSPAALKRGTPPGHV